MDVILAHCMNLFAQHRGMLTVFFLGGLTGSLTHCLVMCGPMVACQAACSGSSACRQRSLHTTQLHYHAGRLVTYGGLGFVAALIGKQLSALAIWPTIAAAMLFLAGGMFIASALPALHRHRWRIHGFSHFTRGVLMGFMPCGLLYAALMMAATLASPWAGMLAMMLFVLGTLPALLLASTGAALLAKKWQETMGHLGRAMMAMNGLTLLVLATRMIR